MEKALQIVDGVALEVQGLQADVLLEVLDRRDSLAVQVEDIVELGGVRVTVWIFARVGICEGQSRVHLREEEGAVGADPTISFWGIRAWGRRGVGGDLPVVIAAHLPERLLCHLPRRHGGRVWGTGACGAVLTRSSPQW